MSVCEIRAVVGAIASNKLRKLGIFDCSKPRMVGLLLSVSSILISVLCTGEGIAFKQVVAINIDTINQYYSLLEEMMKDNTLLNTPHLIFIADETEMPQWSCPGQQLAVRGSMCVLQD